MESGHLVNGLGLLRLNDFDILRSDLGRVPQQNLEWSVGITLQPTARFPSSHGFGSKVDPYVVVAV